MRTKSKKGISLIVLVITIIVMIILATAIILSLSNSSIIEKANKAKSDSDTANLKEYVNTLKAEYELMTSAERNGETFVQYANSKLEEKGYSRRLTQDEILVSKSAAEALEAGLKIGDTVTGYTLAEKTYTTSGNENTAPNYTEITNGIAQTLKTDTSLTWKYIGIGEDGNLEIIADVPNKNISEMAAEYKLMLSGKGGYLNGVTELNKACAALYSVSGKGTATSMNMEHVTRILGYTGEKGSYNDIDNNYVPTETPLTIEEIVTKKGEEKLSGVLTPNGKNTWDEIKTYKSNRYGISKLEDTQKIKNIENIELIYTTNENMTYWLASQSINADFYRSMACFNIYSVDSEYVFINYMFKSANSSDRANYIIRPVVSLDSNVNITKENGVWNIK